LNALIINSPLDDTVVDSDNSDRHSVADIDSAGDIDVAAAVAAVVAAAHCLHL
jgi:hypothetical protein